MKIIWNEQAEDTLNRKLWDATRDALVSYAVFYVFDRLTGNR